MASAHNAAKQTSTPPRLIAFCQTGNTWISRTAVGNTSPCRVQPVPPTPTANEAMKKSRPIMMTTRRRVPDVAVRPSAATSAKKIIPV